MRSGEDESDGIQSGIFIWPLLACIGLMALTTVYMFDSDEIKVERSPPKICSVDDRRKRYLNCINRLNKYKYVTQWHYGNCAEESRSCLRS